MCDTVQLPFYIGMYVCCGRAQSVQFTRVIGTSTSTTSTPPHSHHPISLPQRVPAGARVNVPNLEGVVVGAANDPVLIRLQAANRMGVANQGHTARGTQPADVLHKQLPDLQ